MKRSIDGPLVGTLLAAGAPVLADNADIVILPTPPAAWRTVVGQCESLLELTGDSVDVPPPSADSDQTGTISASALSNAGLRQSVQLVWQGVWMATVRFESREPLDLRPYLGGTLVFDLQVDELAQGGVSIKIACGNGCERTVNLVESARSWIGKGWQRVALSMSCFMREDADFSEVWMPFSLEGHGTGRVSMANVRITTQVEEGLYCPDYRTESVTPTEQTEAFAIDWWRLLHDQQLEAKHKLLTAGTPPQLVFIGDSITQGWEQQGQPTWQRYYAQPFHALDLGIGGDRTENLLWRLQHGALENLAPKLVVMMIGTNNAGGRSPESTAAGIQRLLDEVQQRLPMTKVLLLAIFPRGEKPDDFLRRANERVNAIIASYADGRSVHFLNINAALLEADGSLSPDVMPDFLHPNAKGYEIWQRAMAPVLQDLLSTPLLVEPQPSATQQVCGRIVERI